MSRSRIVVVCLLFASGVLVAPRHARATHKSWLIKDAGSECAFEVPNSGLDYYYNTALYNGASYSRTVGCPLALSGRWGSSSPSRPLPLWASAASASIYINNTMPGTAFTCKTRALLASGVIRYSQSASTTAEGEQLLVTALQGNWGGTLETHESDTVRAIYFDCQVPGNYSAVNGYKVRICQSASCGTFANANGEQADADSGSGGYNYVQTSGIECFPNGNDVWRGHTGIVNNGSHNMGVACPLTPPADESVESFQSVHDLIVYYHSPQNQVPDCGLAWLDRFRLLGGSAEQFWSEHFTPFGNGAVRLEQTAEVRLPVGMAVHCDLPPGTTLQGITALMTVADVTQGM